MITVSCYLIHPACIFWKFIVLNQYSTASPVLFSIKNKQLGPKLWQLGQILHSWFSSLILQIYLRCAWSHALLSLLKDTRRKRRKLQQMDKQSWVRSLQWNSGHAHAHRPCRGPWKHCWNEHSLDLFLKWHFKKI